MLHNAPTEAGHLFYGSLPRRSTPWWHRQVDLPVRENRWIVHVSIENLLPSRKMSLIGRMRLRLFLLLRQISQPAHYFCGLGDNVQLSAEIIPVRIV